MHRVKWSTQGKTAFFILPATEPQQPFDLEQACKFVRAVKLLHKLRILLNQILTYPYLGEKQIQELFFKMLFKNIYGVFLRVIQAVEDLMLNLI